MCLMVIVMVGCEPSGSGAAIGDTAYDFEVEDFDGQVKKLSDFRGKTVFLLAWTTT